MPFSAPLPAGEPVDQHLRQLFARAGADWTLERTTKPPLPNLCPEEDRWLVLEFPAMVLRLADRLRIDARSREGLRAALRTAKLQTARITPVTAALLTRERGPVAARKVGRTEACNVATAYFRPLLDPQAYRRWLDEMARTRFFWRGGEAGSPAVPEAVWGRERAHDARLLERWVGAPPQAPTIDPSTPERTQAHLRRRHERALSSYEMNRLSTKAFVESEPAAPGLSSSLDLSARELGNLQSRRRTAAAQPMPVVVLDGVPEPANLFISEVARPMSGYLALLEPVLRSAASEWGLYAPLMGVAYATLSLSLIPLNCLYDGFHGTCTVENLLPRSSACVQVLHSYVQRPLREVLAPLLRGRLAPGEDRFLSVEDPAIARVLDAFEGWTRDLTTAVDRHHNQLLKTAAEQSGGRVRTPERLTPGGRWSFGIKEQRSDGSVEEIELHAPEVVAYEQHRRPDGALVAKREADQEIFWLLRAIWAPVGTAVALTNQAGMRFWFNAANNRWGGHHPPHRTHRQGSSVDFDVGFGWRPGHKVPNVKKRDHNGFPLSDELAPGNSANADCLHGMDRIAGWVGTQAFLLVGVTQYLYGDAALVEEAAAHLAAHFELKRPARLDGVVDAEGHNDHWHFEVLVGERPADADPYVWQVPEDDLLSSLYRLAKQRDEDPSFWAKIANLSEVPQTAEDFEELPDAEDWMAWWELREGGGIPLLPVWAPSEEGRTFGPDRCFEPKRDVPGIFKPGELGA